MAKGGNLLDDDDSGDGSFDDFEDELDGGQSLSGSQQKKGGGLVKTISVVLVSLLVFGGIGWAGYQYWWIPRQLKKKRFAEAKKRELLLKRENAAKRKKAQKERKKRMALLQKKQDEAEVFKKKQAETEAKLKKIAENKAASSGEAENIGSASGNMSTKKIIQSVRSAPTKTMDKAVSANGPARSMRNELKKKKVASIVAQNTRSARPVSEKIEHRPEPPAPSRRVLRKRTKPKGTTNVRKKNKIARRYYSVQIATCRTDKCVRTFMAKLRAIGYRPFVSRRAKSFSSLKRTEVLLGNFSAKPDALSIASRARAKKIQVSVYKVGAKWLVSAGSYSDLEDAAQRLDIIEDLGLRAKLAPRTIPSRKSVLRAVRIGRLSSRREAKVILGRISKAGFRGSYVVRRK